MQDRFKVLPTDSRFKELTSEQVDLLYQHYLLDNPEVEKHAEVFSDPGYEEAEKAMLVDARSVAAKGEPELDNIEVEVKPI